MSSYPPPWLLLFVPKYGHFFTSISCYLFMYILSLNSKLIFFFVFVRSISGYKCISLYGLHLYVSVTWWYHDVFSKSSSFDVNPHLTRVLFSWTIFFIIQWTTNKKRNLEIRSPYLIRIIHFHIILHIHLPHIKFGSLFLSVQRFHSWPWCSKDAFVGWSWRSFRGPWKLHKLLLAILLPILWCVEKWILTNVCFIVFWIFLIHLSTCCQFNLLLSLLRNYSKNRLEFSHNVRLLFFGNVDYNHLM